MHSVARPSKLVTPSPAESWLYRNTGTSVFCCCCSRRKNAFVMDRIELCFPSEEAKRDVFHTATFLRLHGKLTVRQSSWFVVAQWGQIAFEKTAAFWVLECIPNKRQKRHLSAPYTFLPLQGFDRWARDLEMRNFSVLKSTYSRLWAETPYALFSHSDAGPSQEAAAAVAAALPPVFDFSIDGLLQAKGTEQRDTSTQR